MIFFLSGEEKKEILLQAVQESDLQYQGEKYSREILFSKYVKEHNDVLETAKVCIFDLDIIKEEELSLLEIVRDIYEDKQRFIFITANEYKYKGQKALFAPFLSVKMIFYKEQKLFLTELKECLQFEKNDLIVVQEISGTKKEVSMQTEIEEFKTVTLPASKLKRVGNMVLPMTYIATMGLNSIALTVLVNKELRDLIFKTIYQALFGK